LSGFMPIVSKILMEVEMIPQHNLFDLLVEYFFFLVLFVLLFFLPCFWHDFHFIFFDLENCRR